MDARVTLHQGEFPENASPPGGTQPWVKKAIRKLLDDLEPYKTEDQINTPEAEKDIKNKFEYFLSSCGFHMAEIDFAELLNEIKPRDDGGVGWYHQLTPILRFLALVENGTMTEDDLYQYGGLETAVRTHLRHDSIEDTGKPFDVYHQELLQEIQTRSQALTGQNSVFTPERQQLEIERAGILLNNSKLMTKSVVELNEDGSVKRDEKGHRQKKMLFKNTREYIHNMIEAEHASPVVWLLKIGDGTHNARTMLGAPKFTADRRLKYSNEREDMYGPRQGTIEKSKAKWPEFADAIDAFDANMGVVLYLNFGFLEYVDLAYQDDKTKFKEGDAIHTLGIDRYLEKALSVNIPRAFSDVHCQLDRMRYLQDNHPEPGMRQRTKAYLEQAVYPVLEPYKEHFPEIFPAGESAPSSKPQSLSQNDSVADGPAQG